ncbi:MAG: VWA domain-containing protein, partial [Promicromonosporaceae bacterium]|nr:VWA domain-containing protein [Promicromonosporaceae bacterium]
AADTLYLTGASQFMNPAPEKPTNDFERTQLSTGYFTLARENAPLPQTCRQFSVAMVLDVSNSMGDGTALRDLKDAATGFIQAFTNTDMVMQLFRFATEPEVLTGRELLTPQGAANLINRTRSLILPGLVSPETMMEGGTNYDAALWSVANAFTNAGKYDPFDVVIFITDGMPTFWGIPFQGPGNETRIIEVDRAVQVANLIKSPKYDQSGELLHRGTRIEVIGAGNAIVRDSETAWANFQAISDHESYHMLDWEQVAAQLRYGILKACQPAVVVKKSIRPWDATDASRDIPTAGWEFTASFTEADSEVFALHADTVPTQVTNGNAASVLFQVDALADQRATECVAAGGTETECAWHPQEEIAGMQITETQKYDAGFGLVTTRNFGEVNSRPTDLPARCVVSNQFNTSQEISAYGGRPLGRAPASLPNGVPIPWINIPWSRFDDGGMDDGGTATGEFVFTADGSAPAGEGWFRAPYDLDGNPTFRIEQFNATDFIKCEVVNRAPRPLELIPTDLGQLKFTGDQVITYAWDLTKEVAEPAHQSVAPGTESTLHYTLDVSAHKNGTSTYHAVGEIQLRNPNLTGVLPLSDVTITVAGEPVTEVTWTEEYPAPDGRTEGTSVLAEMVLAAGETVVLPLVWSSPTLPSGPIEVVVTMQLDHQWLFAAEQRTGVFPNNGSTTTCVGKLGQPTATDLALGADPDRCYLTSNAGVTITNPNDAPLSLANAAVTVAGQPVDDIYWTTAHPNATNVPEAPPGVSQLSAVTVPGATEMEISFVPANDSTGTVAGELVAAYERQTTYQYWMELGAANGNGSGNGSNGNGKYPVTLVGILNPTGKPGAAGFDPSQDVRYEVNTWRVGADPTPVTGLWSIPERLWNGGIVTPAMIRVTLETVPGVSLKIPVSDDDAVRPAIVLKKLGAVTIPLQWASWFNLPGSQVPVTAYIPTTLSQTATFGTGSGVGAV